MKHEMPALTDEKREELVKWLEEGVTCSDEYGFGGNVLKSMKIALAALSEPRAPVLKSVELPGSFRPATSYFGSAPICVMRLDAKGKWLNKAGVIAAIRAAGYEVKE